MGMVRKSSCALALLVAVLALAVSSITWAAPAESLAIRVRLQAFRIANADEDGALSDGDEPYLFVAVVLADGTTIDAGDLGSATIRILSPARTHGNLGLNGVRASERWYSVSTETGQFDATIQPIQGVPLNVGRAQASVGLVVIAMEEDSSSRDAANAARRAFVNTLRQELESAVRELRPLDVDAVRARIRDRMLRAATRETLSGWWNPIAFLAGVADPDDFINAAVLQYSYQQIQNAGAAGLSFETEFLKTRGERVRYFLRGFVRQQ